MKIKTYLFGLVGVFAIFAALTVFGMKKQSEDTKMENNPLNMQTATFAGGCFWCVESDFEKTDGVVKVISGYTGGNTKDPTYSEVSSGGTGHLESVRVYYDADRLTYEKLLDIFWDHIDPTDAGGQFVDRGKQYGTAIFYENPDQKRIAEASKKALDASGLYDKPIVTPIREAGEFHEAEAYHQDFYIKDPTRYHSYRSHSGRDPFLNMVRDKKQNREKKQENESASAGKYAKPPDSVLKEKLTPIQFKVTRENGTEPPFNNDYWNNKKEGIYVDAVSGEPLFSSTDKFESGTGWPSFVRPLEPDNVVELKDNSLFMVRTEVRSKFGDSHLGHLFPDGPEPTGLRYCINSAALRFVPKDALEKEGYGEYVKQFGK